MASKGSLILAAWTKGWRAPSMSRVFVGSGRGGFSSSAFGPGTFPSSRGSATRPTFTSSQEGPLRAAIVRNPKDWAAREQLGALLIEQNNLDAGSAMWEAISADPTNP